MSKKLIRLLVGAALTVAVAYVLVAQMDKVRANVGQRDSIAYWAAGKFLIHRDNPYDVDNTFDLEIEQGYAQSKPVLPRTPPRSLFLFLPLGLVNAFSELEMLLLIASHIPLQSGIYFWSSLLWCAWHFYGRHRLSASLIYGLDSAVQGTNLGGVVSASANHTSRCG
jgi:hypothetical protein